MSRGGKDRCQIQSAAHCHAHRRNHEQSSRRSDAGHQVAATVQDRTGPDETNAWDNLRRNSGVVSEKLDRQLIRQQGEHGGAKAYKEICAQSGRPVFELAFQPDSAAENGRQHQAQQGNPCRRHFVLQNVVDVVHDRHGSEWLDFITGKLDLAGSEPGS